MNGGWLNTEAARQSAADARQAVAEARRAGCLPLALTAIAGPSVAAIIAGLVYLSLQSDPCI